jgi:hypothetical protein
MAATANMSVATQVDTNGSEEFISQMTRGAMAIRESVAIMGKRRVHVFKFGTAMFDTGLL